MGDLTRVREAAAEGIPGARTNFYIQLIDTLNRGVERRPRAGSGPFASSDDLVQEAALEFRRNFGSKSFPTIFRKFGVRVVALRLLRDAVARQIRRSRSLKRDSRKKLSADLLTLCFDPSSSHVDVALRKDLIRHIRNSLKPLHQEILDRLGAGESVTEIGKSMGISRDAVNRAIEKIRAVARRIDRA